MSATRARLTLAVVALALWAASCKSAGTIKVHSLAFIGVTLDNDPFTILHQIRPVK